MVILIRSLIVFTLIGLVGVAGAIFWHLEHRKPSVHYNDFLANIENNQVTSVHITGDMIIFTDTYNRQFSTYSPNVADIIPQLLDKNIAISGESDTPSPWWNLLASTIPIFIFMVAAIFFMRRQASQQEQEEVKFAREKAVSPKNGARQVTFRDVAGLPEAKDELLEIIDFLQKPKKYSSLGAIIPKGILFQGPPGTGKTLLAKAIAGEAGVPFYSISGSDFVEMFVGVGASRVRELFREAKKNKPCIIFIDEIDAVGGHRSSGGMTGGGQDERGQTLNALLVEMDGFSRDETIIVLAATNRPDILDPALLRPGRFDRQISVLPPDVKGRLQILKVHTSRVAVSSTINLEDIARTTPGFTGAELANLVNEAALIAGRANKKAIDLRDFEAAKDRVLMGVERKGLVISEKDRRTMAYHEAGHAVLAKFLPEADPLHKITIIPRGKAMGHTQQLPLQDRHAYSKEYLLSRITILMGGRAAEEIVLNQQTTGAEDDFHQAITIASNMVCKWGMNDVIGPLSYAYDEEGFLGQTGQSNYSAETAHLIDMEIKKMVESCYENAKEILTKEQDFLRYVGEILLQTETLDREELEIIFECSQRKSEGADSSPDQNCRLPDKKDLLKAKTA